MQKEPYCKILGINPFKESEYDAKKLDGIIRAACEKWTRDSTNIDEDVRLEATRNLDKKAQMNDALLDPESRGKEFEESRKTLKSLLMPLMNRCLITEDGKKYAFPRAVQEQLSKIGWKGIGPEDVAAILGLEKGRPEPPVSPVVSNSYSYLQKVKASTPMDALNALISNPSLGIQHHYLNDSSGTASVKEALSRCLEKLAVVKLSNFPEINSYLDCLRKLNALTDEELGSLIAYSRCCRDLDDAMDALVAECSFVTRKQIDELLPSDVDLKLGIPVLESFCYKKGIAANFSRTDTSLARCPRCLKLINEGKEAMVCPYCGTPIKAKCPRCGTMQSCDNKICMSCGFDFVRNVANAKKMAVSFRSNLKKGDLQAAKADLVTIKESYSANIKTATLENEYERCREDLEKYSSVAKEAYRCGRYYSALAALRALERRYQEVIPNNPDLDSMYRSTQGCFDLAQESCDAAKGAEDEKKRLELYIDAAEHCMDHPAARQYLRSHPPQGVADCKATPTKDGTILLTFTPLGDSKGVSYCVYRGTEVPVVNEDTAPFEVLSRHKAETGFEDKTVESGVKYHYVVASRRWGILSRPMQHIGPVVAFENVRKVSINPTEDGFHISFERPKGAHAVRISRCVRGDEENCTDVEVGSGEECDDFCLVGNIYIYYFQTEYMVGDVLESSS